MKRVNRIVPVILFVVLTGCTSSELKKENLKGTWQIVSYEASNPDFPYLTPAIKNEFTSTTYTLHGNSSYEMKRAGALIQSGTWFLLFPEQVIMFTSNVGGNTEWKILKFRENSIELVDKHKYAKTDILIKFERRATK